MKKKTGIWIMALLIISLVSYGAGRYQEVTAALVDDVKIRVNAQSVQLKDVDGSKLIPLSYNGRTYLPVRAVADLLNYEVAWDDATRTVSLSSESSMDSTEESGYASIAAAAYMTGKALESKDYSTLALLAHPQKGIRFSINGLVVLETDVVLMKSDLQKASLGSMTYTWGVEDGSWEPLVITTDDFMERFNDDIENALRTGWNERVTGYGIKERPSKGIKVLDGGESVYANCEFVEYYFEGNSGLEFDWNSTIMVFEKVDDQYFLVGVLNNYWLI